jgi:hypothetical protein
MLYYQLNKQVQRNIMELEDKNLTHKNICDILVSVTRKTYLFCNTNYIQKNVSKKMQNQISLFRNMIKIHILFCLPKKMYIFCCWAE